MIENDPKLRPTLDEVVKEFNVKIDPMINKSIEKPIKSINKLPTRDMHVIDDEDKKELIDDDDEIAIYTNKFEFLGTDKEINDIKLMCDKIGINFRDKTQKDMIYSVCQVIFYGIKQRISLLTFLYDIYNRKQINYMIKYKKNYSFNIFKNEFKPIKNSNLKDQIIIEKALLTLKGRMDICGTVPFPINSFCHDGIIKIDDDINAYIEWYCEFHSFIERLSTNCINKLPVHIELMIIPKDIKIINELNYDEDDEAEDQCNKIDMLLNELPGKYHIYWNKLEKYLNESFGSLDEIFELNEWDEVIIALNELKDNPNDCVLNGFIDELTTNEKKIVDEFIDQFIITIQNFTGYSDNLKNKFNKFVNLDENFNILSINGIIKYWKFIKNKKISCNRFFIGKNGIYSQFKNILQSYKRFIFIIDRRYENEIAYIIIPPNNSNKIFSNKIYPIINSEQYFKNSSNYLFTIKNLNNENELQPVGCYGKIKLNNEKLILNVDGQLSCFNLNFQFHVINKNIIRCYISYQSSCLRFFINDMIEILPMIFINDKNKLTNKNKKKIDKFKDLIDVNFFKFCQKSNVKLNIKIGRNENKNENENVKINTSNECMKIAMEFLNENRELFLEYSKKKGINDNNVMLSFMKEIQSQYQ